MPFWIDGTSRVGQESWTAKVSPESLPIPLAASGRPISGSTSHSERTFCFGLYSLMVT